MSDIIFNYINGHIQCEIYCPYCGKKSIVYLEPEMNYWVCQNCHVKMSKDEFA